MARPRLWMLADQHGRQVTESVNRSVHLLAQPIQSSESYGRTDGLTKMLYPPTREHLTSRNASRAYGETHKTREVHPR